MQLAMYMPPRADDARCPACGATMRATAEDSGSTLVLPWHDGCPASLSRWSYSGAARLREGTAIWSRPKDG